MQPQPPEFNTLGKPGAQGFHGLEVIDLGSGSINKIVFKSDEVAAVCPVTGQPDWYTVSIELRETEKSIESKSLKLYLQSFRNEGIFCENLAKKICQDVTKLTTPTVCIVNVTQKSRGGVTLTATDFTVKDIELKGGIKGYK